MKITTPLSRVNEIAPLIKAGADEFYCSVVPDDWLANFGNSATSRRPFGNLPSENDLDEALKIIHGSGKHLSLVMNAQYYTAKQLDSLLRLAERFTGRGGDALIIGDPTLLSLISEEEFDVKLHVSSIAACRNGQSAAFYRELGANRIIFPRDLTLSETQRIIKAVPDMEYEAFVLNDGCVFEEGVCQTIHLPGQLGGAICMDNYKYTYRRIDGQVLSESEKNSFAANDQCYEKWLWYRFGCGFSVTEQGYPYGPCGLCAIADLEKMGVQSVKIAGRDAPLERKTKSVEMVRLILDKWEAGENTDEVATFAKSIRGEPEHCYHGQMCYYPEVVRNK